MTAQRLNPGSRTGYTITLNSLASATYVASSAVDLADGNGLTPLDVIVEVEITPGTVSGNKQAKVFVQASLDATNYSTGPTSGTTTTDEPDLLFLGVLPLNSASTLQRKQFSVLACLGFVPRAHKLVVLNDSGAAFAGSGCAANYQQISGDSR